MEMNKSIDSSQLPEEMIQHIQSFLSGKEAARTTIFSKFWYTAWLTRPNLDFDEYYMSKNCETPPSESDFVKLGNKTMQRYEESNLKIQSFSLVYFKQNIKCSNKLSLANKWTTKALKLGATDIEIKWSDCNFMFVLPREVLESETLVKLSLSGGRIDLRDHKKVSCWRLKSLSLRGECIEGDNLWDIISMCPSIEEFKLSSYGETFVLKPRLGVNDFHKLKVLTFYSVEIGEWFFRDLSSKFPCLEEFSLGYCTGDEEIQICSNSLECICISDWTTLKLSVKLEVPRIRKFKYSSSCIPSLSFKTTSREWQSEIFVHCNVDSSWFVELRNFLMELKSSKNFLYLWIDANSVRGANHYFLHSIGLLEPRTVYKLAFGMGAPSSFFWTCSNFVSLTPHYESFWTWRPNFMSLMPHYKKKEFKVNYTLIKEEFESIITSSLYDLEEVNIHVSDGTEWTWTRPLPTMH